MAHMPSISYFLFQENDKDRKGRGEVRCEGGRGQP